MFFTESGNENEPDFGNYALGGSVTFNLNRWIAVEGEGGGTLGIRQNFTSAAANGLFKKAARPDGRHDPGQRGPTFIGKAGFDRKVRPDLRIRMTGSDYKSDKAMSSTLYGGDRAGDPRDVALRNAPYSAIQIDQVTAASGSAGDPICESQ
jgi:hypothetical protein